jgi:hypothetical protein
MVVYPVQVGDVFTMKTPEEALDNMIILHKHGIETCLHSYFNGNELTALEIVHIPEYQLVKYKEEEDE